MKIIFMGTPEFGAIILEKLAETPFKPILVVTSPDKPVGRKQILTPPPVKVIAQKYGIPVEQPDEIENCKLKIENLKPDLGIVAAYGKILPKDILNIPKFGFLNVHPSLLPKYRGPSPIRSVILENEEETGVTIILMDEKMDHGPILKQKGLKLRGEETFEKLTKDLAELGSTLLINTIPFWLKGVIEPRPQDEREATYTKIFTREDGEINWQKSAEQIEREIRAFYPWPGSYTFWRRVGKWGRRSETLRIKIIKAKVSKSSGILYPIGKTIAGPDNKFYVQCGGLPYRAPRDFLLVEKLQLEGKKPVTSEEFLRGYPDFIGTILQ
ncbi:methionyl-tRNA formyltransferase [bacterium]|nr:methionyl-tRNA formyltransferase [bacterium]